MVVDTPREWRIIFFPWRALFIFMALGVPFALALSWLVNSNAGYILMVTIVGQYLIYETFHYCCHVHENWFVRNMPFVNTIRRYHTVHHSHGIMMDSRHEPHLPDRRLADGHERPGSRPARALFNGYSLKHVKPELRVKIEKHLNEGPDRMGEGGAVPGAA